MTWGMVSPTMMQKAIMPPKALGMLTISTRRVGNGDGLQGPLGNGNGNKAGFSKAMLDCCLEGIGTAELRICDDQTNGPINSDGQDDEEDDTCKQTGLAKGIRLANDTSTTSKAGQTMAERAKQTIEAHMMLLAMFMKALDMELLGRALSNRSWGSKSDSARVTAGASMPVRRGAR